MTSTRSTSTRRVPIVDACSGGRGRDGTATYTIFILAPNGDIVEAHAMDGVGAHRHRDRPAEGQDRSLRAVVVEGRGRAVRHRRGRLIRTDLGRDSGLAYYFVGGGLPILVDGELIGAIGVGGGNHGRGNCATRP